MVSTTLANDLLRGAGEIAAFLFGDDTPANRRSVYHLSKTGRLPMTKLGSKLCACRSALDAALRPDEPRKSQRRS